MVLRRERGQVPAEQEAEQAEAHVPASPGGDIASRLLHCQATGGNQMVLRLLADSSASAGSGTDVAESSVADAIRARLGGGSPLPVDVRAEAEAGLGQQLGDVRLHTDAPAATLATQLQAQAFTTGNDIFFNQGVYDPGSSSGYKVLVHELTHTLQQASGAVAGQPAMSGLAVSDVHDADEREARTVADRVGARRTSQPTAESDAGPAPDGGTPDLSAQLLPVQRLGTPLNEPVPASDPTPIAEKHGVQRQYTPAQYIEMWEKEQGRKLTTAEEATIARGCIGLTANNLNGGGNPPLDLVFGSFKQAHEVMTEKNRVLDWLAMIPFFGDELAGKARYVVFAKLFWSNQDVDAAKRAKSDPTAFRPDPKTGQVDMTGYAYRDQPGFVNFDYGWWDEASQAFWHANHMDYGDPADPMIVLQSTEDKFATKVMVGSETRYGYVDFDRVIYGVALANNYDPVLAAAAAAKP